MSSNIRRQRALAAFGFRDCRDGLRGSRQGSVAFRSCFGGDGGAEQFTENGVTHLRERRLALRLLCETPPGTLQDSRPPITEVIRQALIAMAIVILYCAS